MSSRDVKLPEIPGYDVDAELGRGGMGVVYRVRRHETGRVLALKMILCGQNASFQELARFRIEAEAMACLNHPNIVKIRDVGVFSGYPFFAMDFAERGSLKQVTRGCAQPIGWSVELVKTLARAMQHAHGRGMLHRDLKPANVLILEDGTPKISDFGLVKFAAPISKVSASCCTFNVSILDVELERFARELGSQYRSVSDSEVVVNGDELTRTAWQECATRTGILRNDDGGLETVRLFLDEAREQQQKQVKISPELSDLTSTGAVMGSPSYMAPEQAIGDLSKIGPATDVYALGGIFYELLTGRLPVSTTSFPLVLREILEQPPVPLRRIDPTIPRELEAVCLRCLEKEARRRYPRAGDLADELQDFLDGNDGDHRPETPLREGTPAESSGEWAGDQSTLPEDQKDSSDAQKSTRAWWFISRKPKG